ncbi:glycosyltransferase family 2 protein [Aestuariicella sp. G3-2]|uniref:glycosyltransferase family 2 protein n=1 Tax=Pseudomaricurvus albidus TaxID=2842452 RepID=UPI001C0AD624|nr:glycosyltransferase family A protein [Aestuariicella albida]MBU3071534.1 glycosyltransferase family 2 protein [Aestuariicella albida]
MMTFSLIVATLGRLDVLRDLLKSLEEQTERSFEVIVVDQNPKGFMTGLLNSNNWSFPIVHVEVPEIRGLSRARNIGIKMAQGDQLIFPDDDCWYPSGFLALAKKKMDECQCDVLTGRAAHFETKEPINGKYPVASTWVDRKNVFSAQIEWVVCFKKEVILNVGGYDENIGVGASSPWQSTEGPELTVRILDAGYTVFFCREWYGFHEELNVFRPDSAMIRKGRGYARGYGHVVRIRDYSRFFKMMVVIRPFATLLKAIVQGNWSRVKYNTHVILGRCEGVLGRVF